jgi:LysM repeat protein
MGTVNFNLPNKNITVISGELDTNGAYYTLAAGNKIYFSFTGHTATINLYSGTWDFTVDGSTASGVTIPDGFTQHALLTAGSDTTHTVVATLVSTTGITAFNRTSSVVVTSAGTPTLSPYTGFGPFYRYADISTLLALEGKWTESSNTRDVHSVHAGQGLSIKGTATAVRILTYTDLGTLVNLQVNRAAPVATVTYSGDGTYDLVSLATGLDNSTEKTFTIRTLKQGLNVGGLFFLGIMFVGGDVGSTPPAAVDLDVVYGDSIEALYLSTDPADEGLIEAGVANQQGCSIVASAGRKVVDDGQTDALVTSVLVMNPANVVVNYGQNDTNNGTFQTAYAAMIQKMYDGVGAQAGLRTATGAKRLIILGCYRENDDATVASKNTKIQAALATVTVPAGAPMWEYVPTTGVAWPQQSLGDFDGDNVHPNRQGRLKQGTAEAALLAVSITRARRRAGSSRTGTRTPIYG